MKKILLLALVIWVLPVVFGVENFEAYSSEEIIDVCVQTSAISQFEIQNTGTEGSFYSIEILGSGAEFARVVPSGIGLAPGEKFTFEVMYEIPRDRTGNYESEIIIKTNKGMAKSFKQKITARLCGNNLLLSYNFNQTGCPCESYVYNFTLKNTGPVPEKYHLTLDKMTEYALVSDNDLVLAGGEERDISLYLDPDCSIYGEFLMNFVAEATNSGLKSKIPLVLNIEKCYDYSLDAGDLIKGTTRDSDKIFESDADGKYKICTIDSRSVEIGIFNEASFENSFELSLDGPNFGKLSSSNITIDGNSQGVVLLTLDPREEGVFNFLISSKSELGEETVEKSVEVEVVDCYRIETAFSDVTKICGCTRSEIGLEVANLGKRDEDVDIFVSGAPFLNLLTNNLSIPLGEVRETIIEAYPTCEDSNQYTLYADLFSDRFNTSDQHTIQVVPIEECLSVDIGVNDYQEIYFEWKELPVNVFHEGIKEGKYTITYDAPSWVKIDKEEIELMPGRGDSFNILIDPRGGNVSPGDYQVSVSLQAEDVVYKKDIILMLRTEKGLLEKAKQSVYFYRYWIATIILLIFFLAIVGLFLRERYRVWKIRRLIKQARKKDDSRTKEGGKRGIQLWLWLLFALVILLALGAVSFPDFALGYLSIVWQFIQIYYWYFIIGVVLLIFLIFVLSRVDKK